MANIKLDANSGGSDFDLATSPFSGELGASLLIALRNDIHIPIRDKEFPYRETDATTYEVVARFIFRGTTLSGTPTAAKFIFWAAEAGVSGSVRIYDFTNQKDIAEITGVSNETMAVVTDSSLADLPAGEAIFEIQIKDATGKKVRISEAALIY